jgi:hypothetical protein
MATYLEMLSVYNTSMSRWAVIGPTEYWLGLEATMRIITAQAGSEREN